MNLLSGMEKFGFSMDGELDILADDKPKKDAAQKTAAAPVVKTEKDFIIDKKVRCPVCDKDFPIKAVLATKLKRLEPDFDLRPNYEHVDKCKYDFMSCPNCGYSALDTTFAKIDTARVKLIRAEFCPSFKPQKETALPETYSYEYSIEKFKLALICTMKKRAKMSEKAYVCLKIAWLRRAQLKELEGNKDADSKIVDMIQKEYEGFYSQAYEGFMKAVSSETPPYCGMASEAVEYMLANMSVHYKKYDAAMKLIARLIQSPSTSRKLKDKCLELKEDIVAKQGAK
ncbi:DUF2225 domain-containing protein [Pseudobutyrivibrio ruminis]|uniref:DUF2225 domain-containing protein n=1 Tax=Pseudobutyrivibrio ruminis DSM 9787 TaxID=1123011 RepID=A0A285RD27_9FIRM|nr:DUF2225 domain-containing protein [Pseudobutyrivibrio ruminis]SOB91980.1 hypothetical protein SAMN02910411_0841 [Pseudobutyrivibrio ruminis DSM 9787]